MKTLPLVLAMVFLGGVASLRADLAHDISEKAIPRDKNNLSQGHEYAESLYRIFTQNNVEAYVVDFEWSRVAHLNYQGSFVVFRDSEGRYFGQQSTSVHAKWLAGTTPDEWAAAFYNDSFTQVTAVDNNLAMVSYQPAFQQGLAGK